MKNKEHFKRQLDEIKTEDDLPKAISKLVDVTYEMGIATCKETAVLAEEVGKLKTIICGNGDPLTSILGRLVSVEKKVDDFTEDIKEIKGLLIGGFNQKDLSLKERVTKFEEYTTRSEKLQWFIVTAIIGYIIAQILLRVF